MSVRAGALRRTLVVAIPILSLAARDARGEIRHIDASITAEVREFVAGQEGSFDSAFEELGATSSTLPLQVAAQLLPPENATSSGTIAAAFADFRDPALSSGRNPGEFGLEASAYSGKPEVSLTCEAVATETRTVALSREDLELADGETERSVTSRMFLSGVVIVWSDEPGRDLSGLSAQLDVTVERQAADGASETVFLGLVAAEGTARGDVSLASQGRISAFAAGPDILAPAAGFTQAQLSEELAGLGSVHLAVIPDQEISYSYTARAEEEFSLQATFELRLANLPEGTGVAAMVGRPFVALTDALTGQTAAGIRGGAIQASVNEVASAASQGGPGSGAGGPGASPATGVCGAFGVEMAVVGLACTLLLTGWRRFG